jgi:hypothetical protein
MKPENGNSKISLYCNSEYPNLRGKTLALRVVTYVRKEMSCCLLYKFQGPGFWIIWIDSMPLFDKMDSISCKIAPTCYVMAVCLHGLAQDLVNGLS